MAVTAHGLLVNINGYKAEILINDVPLVWSSPSRPKQVTAHATPWIIDGINDLRMVIKGARRSLEELPTSPPSNAQEDPLLARAMVVEGELGQVPEPGSVSSLATIDMIVPSTHDWSRPFIIDRNFHLSDRPRWSWQDARRVDPLNASVRAQLLSFVRDVHADFANKRVDVIMSRMAPLVSDLAYLGIAPAEARASFEDSFWKLASLRDYDVAPYEESELVFRPIASRKVILVLRSDGSPLMQSGVASSEQWTVPLFIACLEDRFQIVNIG